jgi:hypothetical protein
MSRKRALTTQTRTHRRPGYRRPAADVRTTETCAPTADTSAASEMSSTAHARAPSEMGAAAHVSSTTAEMRSAGSAVKSTPTASVKSTPAASSTATAASSWSRVGCAGQNSRQSHNGKDFEF